MSTQDNSSAPNPPHRKNIAWNLLTGLIIAGIAIAIAIIALAILPPRWHPQLEVKNTGTKAVAFSFKGETFVSQPGQTWHMRFYGGEILTVRTNEAVDAPSITVTLPERNPKPWSLNPIVQRWTADVNGDDPNNIRFENRRFEEISSPRSASEPWP